MLYNTFSAVIKHALPLQPLLSKTYHNCLWEFKVYSTLVIKVIQDI